jgi:hypothetical protein
MTGQADRIFGVEPSSFGRTADTVIVLVLVLDLLAYVPLALFVLFPVQFALLLGSSGEMGEVERAWIAMSLLAVMAFFVFCLNITAGYAVSLVLDSAKVRAVLRMSIHAAVWSFLVAVALSLTTALRWL